MIPWLISMEIMLTMKIKIKDVDENTFREGKLELSFSRTENQNQCIVTLNEDAKNKI
jgi:hypothetical protein